MPNFYLFRLQDIFGWNCMFLLKRHLADKNKGCLLKNSISYSIFVLCCRSLFILSQMSSALPCLLASFWMIFHKKWNTNDHFRKTKRKQFLLVSEAGATWHWVGHIHISDVTWISTLLYSLFRLLPLSSSDKMNILPMAAQGRTFHPGVGFHVRCPS